MITAEYMNDLVAVEKRLASLAQTARAEGHERSAQRIAEAHKLVTRGRNFIWKEINDPYR